MHYSIRKVVIVVIVSMLTYKGDRKCKALRAVAEFEFGISLGLPIDDTGHSVYIASRVTIEQHIWYAPIAVREYQVEANAFDLSRAWLVLLGN